MEYDVHWLDPKAIARDRPHFRLMAGQATNPRFWEYLRRASGEKLWPRASSQAIQSTRKLSRFCQIVVPTRLVGIAKKFLISCFSYIHVNFGLIICDKF
jgi:hypothetical protein